MNWHLKERKKGEEDETGIDRVTTEQSGTSTGDDMEYNSDLETGTTGEDF